jgi:GNAT superfamily N-acetyltransferase
MLVKRLENESGFDGALRLAHEVFTEFEAPHSTRRGIRSFEEFIFDGGNLRKKIENGEAAVWGCFEGVLLISMMAVRDGGHLSLAFTKKEYQRKGAGRLLFSYLRDYAALRGCREITVNSSLRAVAFYKALGFEAAGEECEGGGIAYLPMLLPL